MRKRVTLEVGDQRRWPASVLITKVQRQQTKGDNVPTGGGGGTGTGTPVPSDCNDHCVTDTFQRTVASGFGGAIDSGQTWQEDAHYNASVTPGLATLMDSPLYTAGAGGTTHTERVFLDVSDCGRSNQRDIYIDWFADLFESSNLGTADYPVAGYYYLNQDFFSSTYHWNTWGITYGTGLGKNIILTCYGGILYGFMAITGTIYYYPPVAIGAFGASDAYTIHISLGMSQTTAAIWRPDFESEPAPQLVKNVSSSQWGDNGDTESGGFHYLTAESTSKNDTSQAYLIGLVNYRESTPPCPPTAFYGNNYGMVLVAIADGISSQYQLPYPYSYVSGTLSVTVNGVQTIAQEISPALGTFSLNFTPNAGSEIYAKWQVPVSAAATDPSTQPTTTPQGVPTIPAGYGTVFRKVFTDGTLTPFQVLTYPDAHIGEPGQFMTVFNRFSSGASLTSVHNGYLDLRCSRQSSGTLWNGSLVGTSFDSNDIAHTYGYGVFRFWVRMNVGPGTWQTCWLYDTTNWSAIEIDWPEMLESLGMDAHVIGPGAGNVQNIPFPSDLATVFHCFKIERRATFVAFSIDEVEMGRVTNSMPSDSLAILLDSKVGFAWTGPTGQITSATPNPAYLHIAAVTVDP